MPSAENTGPASHAVFAAVRLRAAPLPSLFASQMSKLVDHGSLPLDARALIASCLPSGDHARSDRSPKGFDGMSPSTPPLTSTAVFAGDSASAGTTNTRLSVPSAHVSQWRMKRWSKIFPLALPFAFASASCRCLVQASASASALSRQSGNAVDATAMRVPSGDSLNAPTSCARSVSCFGVPPAAGIAYSCELPFFALRKYTVLPSGENAGEFTFQPSGVSRVGGAASRANRSSIHNEVLARLASKSTTRLANTSLRPSGDSVGDE